MTPFPDQGALRHGHHAHGVAGGGSVGNGLEEAKGWIDAGEEGKTDEADNTHDEGDRHASEQQRDHDEQAEDSGLGVGDHSHSPPSECCQSPLDWLSAPPHMRDRERRAPPSAGTLATTQGFQGWTKLPWIWLGPADQAHDISPGETPNSPAGIETSTAGRACQGNEKETQMMIA